ncbi:discoidin domain-containing protein [Luteolibacter luteus]|uniref:Protein containing Coagulation factor 5/8 type n=1 Tax=Luteolibacter luteus TaxID=2728835 RepID=A0A858RPS4_9BACT|nr:discoidin domain-containing protein [Luteolibacter luteus]QJE98862.1 protein containing Coagulation factor 5/8 type [Luteolibacter luteus]
MSKRACLMMMGMGALPLAVAAEAPKNLYSPYSHVTNITEGLSWPKGQAVPTFATPAEKLDTITMQDLSKDEQLTFSALQGRVNRKQPRILLVDNRAGEGAFTWADTCGFSQRELYPRERRYELAAKYAKEIDGVVLYDSTLSPHYRNLAGTVASQMNAVPANRAIFEELNKNGANLKVVEDLTALKFTKPLEIYGHMLEKYWPKSEKRLIVSAKPHDEGGGGDYHHTRDIAAATGAAVVWLDTRVPEERDLLRKFFKDMKAGEAIALGWYATERTGITTASEFGIGTMPADFLVSPTTYAGTDHTIRIPAVPKKPELENKVYVAIFISDGDNLQYTQHAMRQNWDRIGADRGKIALNWTIAPGLVDVAPAYMNYYYGSATLKDCFVTGPSGMGYMMPTNTLDEPGAPVGESLKDPAMMDGYTRLTETYLQRSGLRVITIWDEASPALRQAYERNCRHLYGATVQNFKDMPSVASSVEDGRVRFDKLEIPYGSSREHLGGSLHRQIKRWDGKGPHFVSYQVDVWGQLRVHHLIELNEELQKEFPGKVEFVRADHYFNLFNEANGLPHSLTMSASAKVSSSAPSEKVEQAMDGTPTTLWSAAVPGKQSLSFDLGGSYKVRRCVIHHAGDNGMAPKENTKDFAVQVSTDGKDWKTVQLIKGNKDNVTDLEFPAVPATKVRVLIDKPGEDGTARIADVEIFGVK